MHTDQYGAGQIDSDHGGSHEADGDQRHSIKHDVVPSPHHPFPHRRGAVSLILNRRTPLEVWLAQGTNRWHSRAPGPHANRWWRCGRYTAPSVRHVNRDASSLFCGRPLRAIYCTIGAPSKSGHALAIRWVDGGDATTNIIGNSDSITVLAPHHLPPPASPHPPEPV